MATRSEDVWQILAESERQISRFGAKFGGFTEGLALPSMEAVLRDQFGIIVICPSVRICRNGEEQMRIDVLAYANDPINAAYIVDVKNHPVEDSITQLKSILQRRVIASYLLQKIQTKREKYSVKKKQSSKRRKGYYLKKVSE